MTNFRYFMLLLLLVGPAALFIQCSASAHRNYRYFPTHQTNGDALDAASIEAPLGYINPDTKLKGMYGLKIHWNSLKGAPGDTLIRIPCQGYTATLDGQRMNLPSPCRNPNNLSEMKPLWEWYMPLSIDGNPPKKIVIARESAFDETNRLNLAPLEIEFQLVVKKIYFGVAH